MSTWAHSSFLCVDTETTGIDPYTDRIVQVAAVEVLPDRTVGMSWTAIVNPGIDIPEGAAGVHGITTERATTEGIQPAGAVAKVASIVRQHQALHHDQGPVVMFNAAFDWPILLAEAARHGIEFPVAAPVLDPMLLDRMIDRFRKGGRKLIQVAEHYGVPLDEADAHGALADAVAAGRVMRAILDANAELAAKTLTGLYLQQVAFAEHDRLRYVDWKRRNSDPGFDSPAGWPIPAGAFS